MRRRYKSMSLQQLGSFSEVCRQGSYAGAARRLDLSPSTVWEHVHGLGQQLDLSLVESRDGTVRPTPDGQELLDHVRPLLAGLESTGEVMRQKSGRPPAAVTLVSGVRMLVEDVGPVVGAFRQRYPGVRLRLLSAEDRKIEPLVEHGDADLGLMLEPGPGRPPRPALAYEPAYALDYLLVTPPGHPLLAKRGLRLADVVRHPLVVGEPETSSRRRIDEVLYQHRLVDRTTIAVETSSAVMVFAYVRGGAGVGVTAGNPRSFLCQGLGVRSLGRWFGAARYVFVWLRGAAVLPAQREFAETIRADIRRTGSPRWQ
jgi:DNA-binding transcriptional LysR family regulator